MSDLIEEAIEEDTYEQEREASGFVDGRRVTVSKESYTTKAQKRLWKVAVYLDGNETRDNQETQLSAQEAEELFHELVREHDLDSDDTDIQSLDEMEGISDDLLERLKEVHENEEDEQMWCRECGTEAVLAPEIGHYCPNPHCDTPPDAGIVAQKEFIKHKSPGDNW